MTTHQERQIRFYAEAQENIRTPGADKHLYKVTVI